MEREYLPGEVRERIRDLMKERKVTQSDVARMAGCNKSTVSRFLSGQTDSISDGALIAIAKGFNVASDFLLGISDRPDRTNYDLEDLGLSAAAGKALYTSETNAVVINAFLESKSFPALASLIRQYMEGSNAAGFAAQNKLFTMMASLAAGENTEAAAEIRSHVVPVYEADTTHIKHMFEKVLAELRQDHKEDFAEARKLTGEVMEKLMAQLPKDLTKAHVTPEQMVNAVISAAGVQNIYPQEQLANLRKSLLPLFQPSVTDAMDVPDDE